MLTHIYSPPKLQPTLVIFKEIIDAESNLDISSIHIKIIKCAECTCKLTNSINS